MSSACLDDNLAAEFVSGSLPSKVTDRVEQHLAGCRDCRALVAAAAPSDIDSEVVTERRRNGGTAPTLPASSPGSLEPPLAIGDRVGRYLILNRLGAGGMGVVFSAYDPQLDRKVAIKLLRTAIGLGASEAKARLVREAQAIAQLSHANVVAIYDVGTASSGAVYLAMEFVEGETLTQWVKRWDRPWREVLEVFLQAGRGLVAAHSVGLLHRDFKPDNVLVGGDGRVKVTDFGLARSLITGADEASVVVRRPLSAALNVSLTASGTVLGTPRYMAPEQFRGDDADGRADQFSFCVALYEALYGHHPFPGDTALAVVEKDARAELPPASRVPLWIGNALLRGLSPEAKGRFPSMSALLAELTPQATRAPRRLAIAALGVALVAGGAAASIMTIGGDGGGSTSQPAIAELRAAKEAAEAKVRRLEEEKADALRELDRMRDGEDEAKRKAQELAEQIVEKNLEIEVQNQRILALAAQLERVEVARPVRRADGMTVAQAEAGLRDAALVANVEGCTGEWAQRNTDRPGRWQAQLIVFPEGNAVAPEPPGVDVTWTCITEQLKTARFPRTLSRTNLEVVVTYLRGRTEIAVQRASAEVAPPLIDDPKLDRAPF